MRNLFSDGVDELDEVGVPMAIGVPLDTYGGNADMLTVPPGHCFILTRIVGQGNFSLNPIDSSPVPFTPTAGGDDGIAFADAAAATQWSILFRPFIRQLTLFLPSETSPNWRNAIPSSMVNWKLRYPLCVPPGWKVLWTGGGDLATNFIVYGRMVGVTDAQAMGHSTSSSATDASRTCGVDSFASFSTTQILVPARAGYSIQILDMHIRVQPTAALIANGTLTIEQGDGRPVFVFANNSPAELLERKVSPGLYLKPGQSLNYKSSTALIGSGVISWRYVIETDVPSDHYWACVEPGLPTPAVRTTGTNSIATVNSHEITLFYPRRATTKTSPTTGFQHLLRGYVLSMQKDTTLNGDMVFARISTGTTGGDIGHSGIAGLLAVTETSVPLTPAIAGIDHDQNVCLVVDDCNLPGIKDTGSLWIDTLGTGFGGASSPAAADVDVDEFWVTVWGKTIPSRFTDPVNRGAA